MKTLLVALAFALFSLPALAADQKPAMPKPPEVAAYVKSDAPYGAGTLKKFFMRVYDIALWTDAKRWSMGSAFALTIRYNMNFTVKELVDRTFVELQRQGPLSPEDKQGYYAKLTALYHDVHPGDIISAVYVPKKGAIFYYDGQKRGTLVNTEFAQRFFNIWLGHATSEPALRERLLAGK